MKSLHDLNENILDSALVHLPNLTGLHIINCSKVDHTAVFRVTAHTPLLESLSFTSAVRSLSFCIVIQLIKIDRSLRVLSLHPSPCFRG